MFLNRKMHSSANWSGSLRLKLVEIGRRLRPIDKSSAGSQSNAIISGQPCSVGMLINQWNQLSHQRVKNSLELGYVLWVILLIGNNIQEKRVWMWIEWLSGHERLPLSAFWATYLHAQKAEDVATGETSWVDAGLQTDGTLQGSGRCRGGIFARNGCR